VTLFDIREIFFTAWGYSVSYLEFFGMVSGIIAVVLSSLANVWSWPIGVVNVILSFVLFYQVQLYPDMFLQVFFLVTNLIGWWRWTHPREDEADQKEELKISYLKNTERLQGLAWIVLATGLMGWFAGNLHEWLPAVFAQPSAAPFVDSFITVASIAATFYMIRKKVECWALWLMIDVVATVLYFVRDIKLYSFLYLVFCGIALFALRHWAREYRNYHTT